MDLTKKTLSKLYYENDNKVVCKQLGISNPTLISYLKKFGLPLKQKGNRNPRAKHNLIGLETK